VERCPTFDGETVRAPADGEDTCIVVEALTSDPFVSCEARSCRAWRFCEGDNDADAVAGAFSFVCGSPLSLSLRGGDKNDDEDDDDEDDEAPKVEEAVTNDGDCSGDLSSLERARRWPGTKEDGGSHVLGLGGDLLSRSFIGLSADPCTLRPGIATRMAGVS